MARLNPLKIDPTRTTMLRKKFLGEVNRRFTRLKGRIAQLVFIEDAFGLRPKNHDPFTVNTRWKFHNDPSKIEAFRQWLAGQMVEDLIGPSNLSWWEKYVLEAYAKGMGRAFDDVRRRGVNESEFYNGSRREFLASAFGHPVSQDRLKILTSRILTDLVGVSSAMATQMQRELVDGIARGDSPRLVAKALNNRVDAIGIVRARAIARTETIRAHAEGQLDSLERLGVSNVGVAVEWSTAGFDVCPICQELEGIVVSVKEAHGMLPRHPNCVVGETVIRTVDPLTVMTGKYTGNLLELRTESGASLSVTEHHILLTQRGWVFAKDLTNTDYLINCSNSNGNMSIDTQDKDQTHPSISDVFSSLLKMVHEDWITEPLSMPHYFHGDGKSINSEIKIVDLKGILRSKFDSSVETQVIKQFLMMRDVSKVNSGQLSTLSPLDTCLKRASSSADSLVSRLGISDMILARSLAHHKPIGSEDVSRVQSRLNESSVNSMTAASELLGKGVCAHSSQEEVDNLQLRQYESRSGIGSRNIRVLTNPKINSGTLESFSDAVTTYSEFNRQLRNSLPVGVRLDQVREIKIVHVIDLPVYDVSTKSTFYFANGIVTSNCRCSWLPANLGEDPKKQKRSRSAVKAAIDRSIGQESSKRTIEEQKKVSRWSGADTQVSKDRPESFL